MHTPDNGEVGGGRKKWCPCLEARLSGFPIEAHPASEPTPQLNLVPGIYLLLYTFLLKVYNYTSRHITPPGPITLHGCCLCVLERLPGADKVEIQHDLDCSSADVTAILSVHA